MKRDTKIGIQYASAVGMLTAGVALSVAGFIVSPLGEISDSVLWFAAQTMIYSGSVFGVSTYVQDKFNTLLENMRRDEELRAKSAQKDMNP